MKITKTQLKQLIKEEIEAALTLNEGPALDIMFIPDANFVDFEVMGRDGAFKLSIKTSYGYQELGGTLNATSLERAKEIGALNNNEQQ
tara:strand:- start:162 stop:425 length:264 start_codon:yes stop_codon:yes gene_type:complete